MSSYRLLSVVLLSLARLARSRSVRSDLRTLARVFTPRPAFRGCVVRVQLAAPVPVASGMWEDGSMLDTWPELPALPEVECADIVERPEIRATVALANGDTIQNAIIRSRGRSCYVYNGGKRITVRLVHDGEFSFGRWEQVQPKRKSAAK